MRIARMQCVSAGEYVVVEITVVAKIPGRELREERAFLIPRGVLEECAAGGELMSVHSVVNCIEWFMQKVKRSEGVPG